MLEIMKNQVIHMVHEHISSHFEENSDELQKFEQDLEIWESSEKREIQERLETHQVVEATAQIVEHTPEADTIQFDKGVSPIEFHRPDDLMEIVERISKKSVGEY